MSSFDRGRVCQLALANGWLDPCQCLQGSNAYTKEVAGISDSLRFIHYDSGGHICLQRCQQPSTTSLGGTARAALEANSALSGRFFRADGGRRTWVHQRHEEHRQSNSTPSHHPFKRVRRAVPLSCNLSLQPSAFRSFPLQIAPLSTYPRFNLHQTKREESSGGGNLTDSTRERQIFPHIEIYFITILLFILILLKSQTRIRSVQLSVF